MASRRGSARLGTQGFAFDDWVGPFYPPGTPKTSYLESYAQAFSTVEIDSTFYATPRASVVDGWKHRTPDGFRFSAKFPKSITHDRKLEGAQSDAAAFVRIMQTLSDKLGVLTLQFAYDFTPDLLPRLDTFLGSLPKGPHYAVEVRNRGWLKPDLGEMLSGHGVALVLQDLYYMPKMTWITTDFTVIRWLGRRSDIEHFDRIQIDRTKELTTWAERVRKFLDDGVEVYGYFNNHFAGHSPASVRQFVQILDKTSL